MALPSELSAIRIETSRQKAPTSRTMRKVVTAVRAETCRWFKSCYLLSGALVIAIFRRRVSR